MKLDDMLQDSPPITAMEFASFLEDAEAKEREACAALVEGMKMDAILLAGGEMSLRERRTVRALQKWLAHKIRTRKD